MSQHSTKENGWYNAGTKAGEERETSTAVTTEQAASRQLKVLAVLIATCTW